MSSWEPVTPGPGGYDPNKRYVRASDKQGHYAQIKVSIPLPIAAALGRLVQSGHVSQYEVAQDVMRDAIVHHVNRLFQEIREGYLQQALDMWVIYHDTLDQQHRRSMFRDLMDNIDAIVTQYLDDGRREELSDYFEGLFEKREAIDEEYRDEFTAYIEKQVKNLGLNLVW